MGGRRRRIPPHKSPSGVEAANHSGSSQHWTPSEWASGDSDSPLPFQKVSRARHLPTLNWEAQGLGGLGRQSPGESATTDIVWMGQGSPVAGPGRAGALIATATDLGCASVGRPYQPHATHPPPPRAPYLQLQLKASPVRRRGVEVSWPALPVWLGSAGRDEEHLFRCSAT